MENRQTFLSRLQGKLTQDQINIVEFAYDLSKSAHKNSTRDTGERYFEHPRAGCLILMDELNLYEPNLIISFLLHDTGEDTPLFGNILESYDKFLETTKFRLSKVFGPEVTDITIRLTKPHTDNIRFHTKEDVMSFYLAELKKSEDAILLKSVDRLHNLRSLPRNDLEKISRQIKETEEVYLPIFRSVSGKLAPYAQIMVAKIEEQLSILKANQ